MALQNALKNAIDSLLGHTSPGLVIRSMRIKIQMHDHRPRSMFETQRLTLHPGESQRAKGAEMRRSSGPPSFAPVSTAALFGRVVSALPPSKLRPQAQQQTHSSDRIVLEGTRDERHPHLFRQGCLEKFYVFLRVAKTPELKLCVT